MNGLVCGYFNPITTDEINEFKRIRKKEKLDKIYFYLLNRDSSDYKDRLNILKYSLKPYKKFIIVDKISSEKFFMISEDESLQAKVRDGNFSLVKKNIRTLIMESGLYCENILAHRVKDKRYLHSISVAKTALNIAVGNGLNEKEAYLCGIYHDIAKNLSKEELESYMNIYKPYEYNYPEPVWHQYVGYYLLKNYYGMKSKKILQAIRHHCLGDCKSVLAKVIFVADKIEPTRNYDTTKQNALAIKDINKAYDLVKKQNKEFLEKGK